MGISCLGDVLIMGMEKRLPRGVIIAFEGIDGAGKTTQAHLLVESLRALGWSAIYTKEPTDGPWGQKIRRSAEQGRMPLEEELQAFLEDRREHVTNLLHPAIGTGLIVVLDRYYFSTAAYQGARGASWTDIISTNESFAPEPDLLVFLDIPVDVAMERIRARGYAVNLFEKADALERSAKIFRSLSKPYITVLDGQRSIEDLSAEILDVVNRGLLDGALIAGDDGPAVPPEAVPEVMAAVVGIQNDSSIADADKPAAVRAVIHRATR